MKIFRRILVVDEEKDTIDFVKSAWERKGCKIYISLCEEEIFDLLKEFEFDLILLEPALSSLNGYELCKRIKEDELSSYIPLVMLSHRDGVKDKVRGFRAGADDYVAKPFNKRELLARMEMLLWRTQRALDANPTTRLPGCSTIEREIKRRILKGEKFAVCYADLDDFKAFNDKYGYYRGDKVILLTSRVIYDVTKDLYEGSFVGHIGGDDFIFITSLERVEETCTQIIKAFDAIIPYRYDAEDRERGFITIEDRRGCLQDFPIMTISIGVVTNKKRVFYHPAQVSEIAAEMKKYVKRFEGSNYAIDRRAEPLRKDLSLKGVEAMEGSKYNPRALSIKLKMLGKGIMLSRLAVVFSFKGKSDRLVLGGDGFLHPQEEKAPLGCYKSWERSEFSEFTQDNVLEFLKNEVAQIRMMLGDRRQDFDNYEDFLKALGIDK